MTANAPPLPSVCFVLFHVISSQKSDHVGPEVAWFSYLSAISFLKVMMLFPLLYYLEVISGSNAILSTT